MSSLFPRKLHNLSPNKALRVLVQAPHLYQSKPGLSPARSAFVEPLPGLLPCIGPCETVRAAATSGKSRLREGRTMDDALEGEALEAIEEIFGDRVKRHPIGGEQGTSGALVSVLPLGTHEVELLAKVAERYSIPLVAQGAGTGPETPVQPGSVQIRFDLMRSLWIRGSEELWIRAEPGAPWLELENNLHARGWGLAVYPTSAPRATVGGSPPTASGW